MRDYEWAIPNLRSILAISATRAQVDLWSGKMEIPFIFAEDVLYAVKTI